MAGSVLVDAGFLVALLSARDNHHEWAVAQATRQTPPWRTCDAALSEAFHLMGSRGAPSLAALLRRGAVVPAFALPAHLGPVLKLLAKYEEVPMSFADACLVRMSEIERDPVLLTTDADFKVYRRNTRQMIPARMPDSV
jgi:predicted nucleic acid-binding protein